MRLSPNLKGSLSPPHLINFQKETSTISGGSHIAIPSKFFEGAYTSPYLIPIQRLTFHICGSTVNLSDSSGICHTPIGLFRKALVKTIHAGLRSSLVSLYNSLGCITPNHTAISQMLHNFIEYAICFSSTTYVRSEIFPRLKKLQDCLF